MGWGCIEGGMTVAFPGSFDHGLEVACICHRCASNSDPFFIGCAGMQHVLHDCDNPVFCSATTKSGKPCGKLAELSNQNGVFCESHAATNNADNSVEQYHIYGCAFRYLYDYPQIVEYTSKAKIIQRYWRSYMERHKLRACTKQQRRDSIAIRQCQVHKNKLKREFMTSREECKICGKHVNKKTKC